MYFSSPIPGCTTVTNLLATALLPAGHTLYVYGGGWDYGDTGSGPQSTTLGLSPFWGRFFVSQSTDYDFRRFRGDGINPYYYAGLDCSGYLGWVLYNTLCCQSGDAGFVFPSTHFAKTLATKYGLGSFSSDPNLLRCGDLFSMKGHVWLCVGHCPDGSMVILHSTPSLSITGVPGGGVQLSALGADNRCQAAQLAHHYMRRLAPIWMERYSIMVYPYEIYTQITDSETGCFLWSALSDPQQLYTKTAEEILCLLFS